MHYRLLSLLIAAVIAFGIVGCGGSENNSADPLGTDSLTLTSSATQVDASGTVELTATVLNASGVAVVGREVSFAFAGNMSGASLYASSINTNSSGVAKIIYKAGAVAGTDVVRAMLSGHVFQDIAITVGAGGGGGATGNRIVLSGSTTSLTAGQNSILSATVTDSSGNPVIGQVVAFSFISNASGAAEPLSVLNSGITDASGQAQAVYTAGAGSPAIEVQDTIQATVAGSAAAIIMTRTAAGGGGGTTGLQAVVTATPTSLIAGAMSVLVAQVSNADGTAASGQTVAFAFVVNNSGATLTTDGPPALTVTRVTDSSGKAIATYTAGSTTPGLSIQDVVSASVTGSAAAAIITRLPATGTGNRISLALNPAVRLFTTTSNCIVTATVIRDDGVTPVANEPVTFSIVTGLGTIAPPLTVNTNNSGKANVIFTAPGGATGFEAVVRARILGTTNGGDAVGIIYW